LGVKLKKRPTPFESLEKKIKKKGGGEKRRQKSQLRKTPREGGPEVSGLHQQCSCSGSAHEKTHTGRPRGRTRKKKRAERRGQKPRGKNGGTGQ